MPAKLLSSLVLCLREVEIRAAAKDAVLKEHKDKAKKAGAAKAQVQAPAKGQKVAKTKAPAAPKVRLAGGQASKGERCPSTLSRISDQGNPSS